MVDVICEVSVSQLSDISTLDSVTFLQRTNVTRYRKCHLKKACLVIHLSITASRQLPSISNRPEIKSVPVMVKKNIHDSLRSQTTWRSTRITQMTYFGSKTANFAER